ncbi:hypothetical protein HI914_07316 [Erysiphe necator]|nr:hypothetical protein HI914_07316 [Erysiphe necator]
MQQSLIALNILLLFQWIASVSGALFTCGRISQSIPDYDCDGQLITGKKLKEIVCAVKITLSFKSKYSSIQRKRLKEFYDGPPFTKPYLLWPISPKSTSYKKAVSTPYRVALTEGYQVFSVVMQDQKGVKECRMLENVSQRHFLSNFKCMEVFFPYNELVAAVNLACPKILSVTNKNFPSRYDGHLFEEHGKQRYLYPILINELYNGKQAPGTFRVVINTACRLTGVLMQRSDSNFSPCQYA